MESIGGLKNKSTSSTIQSNAQSSGKLKIKSKIIDGVVAAVSIQANDNTTINQNLILPESSGSKTETLRIKNDVINNNQELEWYRVPEDSYSDLSYDRDVEFDIDVSNLSLNTGLSFDTDGGDFSNLINNKIGEDNNTAQYVRFNVTSNPQIYPQSFTYTPDPTNDHSLRKVQMWIRKYGSGTETDKTMFPSKFEIYGIPRGGSSSDSILITTINSPEVNNMNYSASTEYGLNNPVIDESFNPDALIYDSYEFKIYGNRVDTNNNNYYKPVIGEIKLFGRKVIRNFTNNSIYQLQGISKFETLNVKVVSSSESVNKGDVYKTDLNTSITASNYYIINDITTPNLKFRTGQIYIFNQDNSSNDGHPITFYTDRAKTTEYTNTDNIKYIINDTEYDTSILYSNNFGNNRYRRVKILITDDMPGRLYYQCRNHSNMGGVIETGTATSSGGGGSTLTVQDEGTDLSTAATTLNFEGSGVTASGTGATKTITIDNELTTWSQDSNGHLIPSGTGSYDIGSTTNRVRDLYLSSNSLNIGGLVLSSENDDIKIGDKKLLKEDENQKIPSSKLPISVTHSSNVLSTLTIGDNTYNMPSGGSGGSSTLAGLTDVSVSSPQSGQILQYNGTNWTTSPVDTSKLIVLAGEGVGNLVSESADRKTVDRGLFSLTVSDMYQHSNNYTVNGLCDNLISTNNYPEVFTSETGINTTTLDIIYDFKQSIIANHLKAWPNSYSTSHGLIGAFVIYGSNNNSTWLSLGSQTWTSSDYGFLAQTYAASNNRDLAASFDFNTEKNSYRYYKISVSSNQFGNNMSNMYLYIGEMALYRESIISMGVVSAHTDTSTGNEDYLSALTVEGTKYKIGTTIQNVSYSDSSKLHLSFPFQIASSSADALVNQVDGVDATTSNTTFTEGTGFVYDSTDFSQIDVTGSISGNFSMYMRYYVNSTSDNFQFLLEAYDNDSTSYSPYTNIYWISTGNTLKFASQTTSGVQELVTQNAFIAGRWYNVCVVYNDNIITVYTDEECHGVMKNMTTATNGATQTITKIRLGGVTGISSGGSSLRGNISDFYVFKTALTFSDIQYWADYINNDYVNPRFPAPLKFLADVSDTTPTDGQALVYDSSLSLWKPGTVATSTSVSLEDINDVSFSTTPTDGQALVYDSSLSLWKPGTVATSTSVSLEDINDVSFSTTPLNGDSLIYSSLSSQWVPQRAASQFGLPAGNNAKVWWVAGESVSRVGNYPVTQTGTFDYSYDGDGHLYATNNSGGTRFEINDSNALLADNDRSFTMAIVIDVYDPNVDFDFIALYLQLYGTSNESHWTYIYQNKLYHNHFPDGDQSNPKWISVNNISTGKQLIVLASTEHATNSAIRTISLYINGSLIETNDSPAETYSGSTPNKVYIGGGNLSSRHLHGSKLYSLATWDRTLTTDEINQLTIDKLVSKRQTLPFYQISDNTPIDGQNLVYSSSTGQYEPKHVSPTEIESQLCGGSLGSNDITAGWPRASTVYGNQVTVTYPTKLFDNLIADYYDGWSSLFEASGGSYAHSWNDSTESYDNLGSSTPITNDDQLQIRFNQPRTISKILMLWRGNIGAQFPKSFRIFGSNTQPSAVSSYAGMNLLFQTDGTGYSQPPSITYTGNAQDNLDKAIPFVIPVAKQGAYQYYTFQFDELWSTTTSSLTITEMFFFHKTQNYRNYQYKLQTGHFSTNFSGGNFSDVNGFNNSDALQITLLNNNAKVRLHFNFFGATVTLNDQDTLFQIKRAATNHNDVIINAPTSGIYRASTLTHVTSGGMPESTNDGSLTHNWEGYYVDDLSGYNAGETITYTPQVGQKVTTNSGTFNLNTTRSNSDWKYFEVTVSFFEGEEVMTGPPLTVNNVAISTTPMVGDSLVYDGSVWKSGFAELLQSVSRIGAGYGPPEGFINEDTGGGDHIRGSAPPLGQSAVFVPTEFQGNCRINGYTNTLFDNLTNNFALYDLDDNLNLGPTTLRPYVLDIWIDVPKVVTQYAIYLPPAGSYLPYGKDWQFQVYNSDTSSWVTLDTVIGFTATHPSVPPSQQTSGYFNASVSTSILSRGYRLYFTQANSVYNPTYDSTSTYMQFGEIGMTFKQPTSVTKVNVEGTPTAGDFIQYDGNGSQWVPAFPKFPYIKVSKNNSHSSFTDDGFEFIPFDTVEQSSHNIFSTTDYYHIDVPAGVYMILLNLGWHIDSNGSGASYVSVIIQRGTATPSSSSADFVYDTGPSNLANATGRQTTTPSIVTNFTDSGTIRFLLYLNNQDITMYGDARTNQAYIVKIG
jgi:hypothetical protein